MVASCIQRQNSDALHLQDAQYPFHVVGLFEFGPSVAPWPLGAENSKAALLASLPHPPFLFPMVRSRDAMV